jgi:uncharacterized membrane protein YphA (DoxX/SURF4 family)
MFSRIAGLETLFARVALAAGFLGAVSDRFGFWGPNGARHVAWGDMQHFFAYTTALNPWFPKQVIPTVGVFVTAAEVTLGLALLAGIYTRWAARLSGLLILAFAIGMTAGTGIKSVLNASVLAASACGWLLARAERYPLSVDSLRESPARFS